MNGNQLAMWIGSGVLFSLSLWLFFSAHKMREEVEGTRQKTYRDIRNQIDTSHSHLLDGVRGEIKRQAESATYRKPKSTNDTLAVQLSDITSIAHPEMEWQDGNIPLLVTVTFYMSGKNLVKLERLVQKGWNKK